MTAVRAAISTRTWALASIALICCHRNRSVLRRAQVTHGFFLVHRPDHQLVQHAVAPGIELNRLADAAVLLLDRFVVRGNVQGEFAALRSGLLQLQAHSRDRLRLRSEEHTSELQSQSNLACPLPL